MLLNVFYLVGSFGHIMILYLCFSSVLAQSWEVSYQQDTPVAPRFDVNAPDLYIPGKLWNGCCNEDLKKKKPED